MRLLVTGGRLFQDSAWMHRELTSLSPSTIIQGGARGADLLARRWAEAHNVPCITEVAAWGTRGSKAGPERNQRMLERHSPTLVLAFPGGRGTADMVRRAQMAKVPVQYAKAPH